MSSFILLMHNDTTAVTSPEMWASYFSLLHESGAFEGGSAIGPGRVFRKDGAAGDLTGHVSGYIRVEAESLQEAERFITCNPVFECGGTVEIRELSRG